VTTPEEAQPTRWETGYDSKATGEGYFEEWWYVSKDDRSCSYRTDNEHDAKWLRDHLNNVTHLQDHSRHFQAECERLRKMAGE